MLFPPTLIVPDDGSSKAAMQSSSVVLPAPLGASSAFTVPASNFIEKSL